MFPQVIKTYAPNEIESAYDEEEDGVVCFVFAHTQPDGESQHGRNYERSSVKREPRKVECQLYAKIVADFVCFNNLKFNDLKFL